MISELEFRFQDLYQSDLFVSFLTDHFRDNFIEKKISKTYLYKDDYRMIEDADGNKEYITKKCENYKKYKHYKFNCCVERKVKPFDMKEELTRSRVRSRYRLEEGLELHITKIGGKFNEVEIEHEIYDRLCVDADIEDFYTKAEKYINIFEVHYENLEKLIRYYNPRDSKAPYGTLDRSVVSRARDIRKNDFVNVNGKGLIEGYTVSIKVHGEPLLLYSSGTHIYLVNFINQSFKCFSKKAYEKFIIIGEYISDIETYSPFDILYTDRKNGIRYHPNHLERLEESKKILEDIDLDNLKIYWKPFIPIGKTVKRFEKAIDTIKSGDYPFSNDGIILTPIFTPQNTKIGKKHTSISEVPEILKVKPQEEQSFDVRVDISSKKIYTHMQKEEYKGTSRFPFNSYNVLWGTIPLEADMKIVELIPEKIENGVYAMKFGRERFDKNFPNAKGQVDEVWGNIHDPLDSDLFRAQGIPRLIIQNRRVKTEILAKIPNNAIVVDLGTGKGGDISRYNRASHILCVEPNEKYRSELIERIRAQGLSRKFHVIPCGAQHTDVIIKKLRELRELYPTNPVVVSAMLSMTFFWQNKKFIDNFKNTLKAVSSESGGADFYFFTVEGNKFLEYLEENGGKLNLKKFRAKYNPNPKYGVSLPGKVTIEIDGTIVEKQTEFLVNLTDLDDTLEDMKLFNGKIEDFLTDHEAKMAGASVYGYAKIK